MNATPAPLDQGIITGITQIGTSAQAPAQLHCSSKTYPVAAPFLMSPFSGWADINSFVDHDRPDYEIDGTIILANGLRATSADGEESDLFPAYWSPSLRQYINYDGHNGYDFGISYQPVYAAASGTVSYAGWNGPSESDGYGQMILINHHNGYVTLYGHLSKLEVKAGDHVDAGSEIGISGTTGNSSGPHLHFSVFHNCQITDPYGWSGPGRDPLYSFDNQQSVYLWLPGQEPQILNPPPGWPSFPSGVKIAEGQSIARISSRRFSSPTARLVLLKLPPPTGVRIPAGEALARTEAQIEAEAQNLVPRLEALRRQGSVEGFQIIPAAGAIWLEGSTPAARLESFPGVASLSGAQPTDLTAAQSGLAHSVLIQIGNEQAPSLWPAGFRSALHAWRPLVTVLSGSSLLAGAGLPGQKVSIKLVRHGAARARATVDTDPQSGGFVATLHNNAGLPVETARGDVLEVSTGGREAVVQVLNMGMRAGRATARGRGPAGSTVSLST
ncbi:MAG: M23 family metallopeptidase, partial [Chloroflexota bacterium]